MEASSFTRSKNGCANIRPKYLPALTQLQRAELRQRFHRRRTLHQAKSDGQSRQVISCPAPIWVPTFPRSQLSMTIGGDDTCRAELLVQLTYNLCRSPERTKRSGSQPG